MNRILWSLAVVILSVSLVFYFYTIESFQKIETLKMKISGVTETVDKKFHYFEKNNCQRGNAKNTNCQCVLLLHGLGDFALTWSKILSESENNFILPVHFYAPNLPGALDSPKLSSTEDYNVQKLSAYVADHFLPKCDSWYVVGNSYGGWMATFMALNYPKVKGLLLLAPAGLEKDYSHIVDYFLNPDVEGARGFYEKIYAKPQVLPDFIFKRVVERAKTQTVLDQLKSIRSGDFIESYLPLLRIPVSYFWGDSDKVIPTEWAPSYTQLTPGSELELAEECGHVPQKECYEKVLTSFNSLLRRSVKTN